MWQFFINFVAINLQYIFMVIIGIAGGTGSGKTTVVNKIINSLNYKPLTHGPYTTFQRQYALFLYVHENCTKF